MKIQKYNDFIVDNYSENLKYHIDNNISIVNNIFRPGSQSYFDLLKETRDLFDQGKMELLPNDKKIFENTDIGNFVNVNGKTFPLDVPMINDDIFNSDLDFNSLNESEYKGKKVELNKPKRNTGSGKKYYVYVKNPKTGKIKKVTFGDKKGGLKIKSSSAARRKSFAARHKCSQKKDKTTAGYWACRAHRYFGSGKSTAKYW